MIGVQMRPECWTSQGSLSCSPRQSICHDWTATDATHNCMPDSESIFAVTGSWLISVCVFCLCGIRRWKSHVWWFLRMKKLLVLLQRIWVGEEGLIPWLGTLREFTLLENDFYEIKSQNTFIVEHLAFCCWKVTLKLNIFLTCSPLGILHNMQW